MDAGERETRKGFLRTRRELNRIYGQAQQELQQKVKEYADKYAKEDAKMREKLLNGEITPEEYAKWQRSKVWRGQQWQDKLDSVTRVLADANSEALKIVNGQRIGVFAQNASYQNFCADQAGIGGLWDIYDEATVARLLEENPELLPPKKLIRSKDVTWNRRNVNNCITQGILQGESILDIAKRIAEETGNKNDSQMLRTARTAMTSAQNAGRIEAMREQMNMGIRVKKKWIATLDKHTRDAHQDLDGDVVDVDEPFESKLGKIKFPGDPEAKPANVYNCRCCLGYEYPDFPQQNNTRRDNETNEVIEYQTYKDWKRGRTTLWDRLHQIEANENHERYNQGTVRGDVGIKRLLHLQSKKSIMQVETGGRRNEEELTEEQKEECLKIAKEYGMPSENIVFSNNMYTSYLALGDRLYIGTDVYPSKNPKRANERISHRAALAHEIIGHRQSTLAGHTQTLEYLEEAQASLRASSAPGLTEEERETLKQDAADRLPEGMKLDDVMGLLYLEVKA